MSAAGAARSAVVLRALILAVATIVAFGDLRHCDFVNYDDPHYVSQNPHVQQGIGPATIRWAFTTTHGENWHPLTWLSHMLDVRLFGLDAGAHHLTSLLLHVLNAILLLLVLAHASGRPWLAFSVALLFALHPLHVESVAWLAERKDVLSTCFWMLTMLAYCRYVIDRSRAAYLAMVGLFALGLMAKPMLVTLPFVLLLMDYWPLRRLRPDAAAESVRDLVLEKVPLFVLAGVSSGITFYVQQQGGAVATVEEVALGQRLANALLSYVRYIGKLLWPTNLAVPYPYPSSFDALPVVLAALLLVGVTVFVLAAAARHPYLLVGWLWYLGTLVPVIGLVQVGGQAAADRYTYVPLIGLLIAAVWGGDAVVRRRGAGGWVSGVAIGAAAVACGVLTHRQVQHWRNSETLFRHALAVMPENYTAHLNLGVELVRQQRFDEARAAFDAAVSMRPEDPRAYNDLGMLFHGQGRVDDAIVAYRHALERSPGYADALYNLGRAYAEANRLDDAVAQYEAALRLDPDDARVHNNLGLVREAQGFPDQAVAEFEAALASEPALVDAHVNLGSMLRASGDLTGAAEHYEAALRWQPDSPQALNNLGNILVQQGRMDEAVRRYADAIARKPDYVEALFNLGNALASQGLLEQAIERYTEALRVRPDYLPASQNLERARAALEADSSP